MIYLLLAAGFEEIEAVTAVSLLRRAGISITTLSVSGELTVTGARGVPVVADCALKSADLVSIEGIILPGGKMGADNLAASAEVCGLVKSCFNNKKLVAAICAAPTVLAGLGILEGKRATVYKSFSNLLGTSYVGQPVVVDGNLITGAGPGAAVPFGLEIIQYLRGEEAANRVANTL